MERGMHVVGDIDLSLAGIPRNVASAESVRSFLDKAHRAKWRVCRGGRRFVKDKEPAQMCWGRTGQEAMGRSGFGTRAGHGGSNEDGEQIIAQGGRAGQ